MEFLFDHVVHFVEKPEKAIEQFREIGFHAIEGGVHENRGTYNGLCYFGLSYIELLGAYDLPLLKETQHPPYSLVSSIVNGSFEEGLVRVALRTSDIHGTAAHFKSQGLIVSGPVRMHRKRPDGSLVKWQLLYVGHEDEGPELPFFIQWEEDDEQRREDLLQFGFQSDHSAGGSLHLQHVAIAVKDLDKTIANWSKWLNIFVGETYTDETLHAIYREIQIPGGSLVFYEPIGEGIVSNVLATSGEKPFRVVISGGDREQENTVSKATYVIRK